MTNALTDPLNITWLITQAEGSIILSRYKARYHSLSAVEDNSKRLSMALSDKPIRELLPEGMKRKRKKKRKTKRQD